MLPHSFLRFQNTLALAVIATALVTKRLAAAARHMVTACGTLYPKLAVRTLLVFLAFYKF